MDRVMDWFECDGDGYPEEASIERLRSHKFTMADAGRFWWEDFPAICQGIGSCQVTVTEGKNQWGADCHFVQFSTGGWSGAEELIGVALAHFWLAHFHTKWERGGHFWFEVPKPKSAPVAPSPPQT